MTKQLWVIIVAMAGTALALFVVGALRNHNLDYWYLPYNLALAVVPLALAWGVRSLAQKQLTWQVILLTGVWLAFLPNSFYIVTDFIHLPETVQVDMTQDIVMLFQFSLLGMILGFLSLVMVHRVWRRYLSARVSAVFVGVVLFLCSFAMYLGRELRWNSWDVITNPIRVLTDVGEIIFHPLHYSEAWWMSASFLAMLGPLYMLVWVVNRRVVGAGAKNL